jgi:hypothetical protein
LHRWVFAGWDGLAWESENLVDALKSAGSLLNGAYRLEALLIGIVM